MAKIERFEDLQCWQKARQLANAVYDLPEHPKFAKDSRLWVRFKARRDQSCIISPKDLILARILNSFDFKKWHGGLPPKLSLNFIWLSIENTLHKLN
ncbi:MAG: hypothetical protein ACOYZ6_11030 [Chloroflexota bacterium]